MYNNDSKIDFILLVLYGLFYSLLSIIDPH